MSKPVILVVVNCGWGAIDWLLPVLSRVHDEDLGDVVVYFKDEESRRRASQYQDLDAQLRKIAQVWDASDLTSGLSWSRKLAVIGQSFAHERTTSKANRRVEAYGRAAARLAALPVLSNVWRSSRIPDIQLASLLRQRLAGRRVACLMQDFGGRYDEVFHHTFSDAALCMFPNGTNWWDPKTDLGPTVAAWMQGIRPDSSWLTGWPEDETFFRRHGLRCQVVPCGQPKFDPAWLKRVAHARSTGKVSSPGRRLNLLFLSRPLRKTADPKYSEHHVEALLRVAQRHGVRVHIKLHPNQRAKEIEPLLKKVGGVDHEWSTASVSASSAKADFAVALPTSAAVDAAVAGIPCFEFFDYTQQQWTTFVKDGGRTTSIYRQRGLVEAVDTESQLDDWIARIRQNPGLLQTLAAQQQSALAKLLPARDGAIEKAVAVIRAALRSTAKGPIDAHRPAA